MALLSFSAFTFKIKKKLILLSGAVIADHSGNALVTESGGVDVSAIDTDNTLAADSDAVVPSQKAIKAYVDGRYPDTGASAAELNYAADVSSFVEELTSSAAVADTTKSLELNHATVAVEATIADAADHPGFFFVKDTSATGTAAHTVTLTAGTWDGSHSTITLNALNEAILVYFDSAGNGTVIVNVGSVALS